jgi:hypothetical protein
MITPERKSPSATRRYLVHLFGAARNPGQRRYLLRIQPWTPRNSHPAQACERLFEDEVELIRAVNPFLPPGSDVRYVLMHIESPEGFLYLLRLTAEQASALGWRDAASGGGTKSPG